MNEVFVCFTIDLGGVKQMIDWKMPVKSKEDEFEAQLSFKISEK